ncbi:MAG: N-acetylmuramoyl-L-alanine amidase [Chitinophagaceae bacterium]|nr:MAG: N-acetylmuramoyl-L-alanine amidase [Chitinophagaceae bacterium]
MMFYNRSLCKIFLSVLSIACCFTLATAQTAETPFIKIAYGTKEQNKVTTARQFIVGSTCKICSLTINNQPVKVYNTGAFAFEVNMQGPDSTFVISATAPGKKAVAKTISYSYAPAKPAEPVKTLSIESIQTLPEGNLLLMPGDKIQFRVKALPGASVTAFNNMRLYEMPPAFAGGMKGIYQGEYIVQITDSFKSVKIPITLSDSGRRVTKETRYHFSVFSTLASDVALTKGRLAHLEYGLGEDRLGGAKIGYLDSLVQLKVVGKVGSDFKIQLAKNRIAYIPDDLVTLLPKGSFTPSSLTGSWAVYGDEKYDYVNVSLGTRLPYQSMQELNPSRIIVDVFGATNNSNWISQLNTAKEIEHVDYEQIADDIFRIKIQLKHAQHWGHQLYYRGNTLVIKIKQQPQGLALGKLTIALDAGHGGSNQGASGPTGSSEKQLALAVTLKLQKALQGKGAKVIMTRTVETTVDNKERILFYRDSVPDLLVSIHLNSSGDPLRAGGTSTHYRYIGNKKLNSFINNRMQELGLRQYGVVGSFNFMLNSPTEYPNVLVETLFLSNPAEEAMMLNENFQQQMADKILQGIEDFLADIQR